MSKKEKIEKLQPNQENQEPNIDEQIRMLTEGEQRAFLLAQKYNDQESWDMLERIKQQKLALLQEKQKQEALKAKAELERQQQELMRQRELERQQMFNQLNYNPNNLNVDPFIAQFSHQKPLPSGISVPTTIPQPSQPAPNPQMFNPTQALTPPKQEGTFTFIDRIQTLIQIIAPIILIILVFVVILFK